MSLRIAVCTVSDTRTVETDKSGGYLFVVHCKRQDTP